MKCNQICEYQNLKMSRNLLSTSRRAVSVAQQEPQNYFTLSDPHPEYVHTQRVQATITGVNKISFNTQTVDPNLFLRSRAYLKVSVLTQRERVEEKNLDFIDNEIFDINDLIYKKPGMVLANSMTNMKLRLNNITIDMKDPRYYQRYITAQHCGKEINNNYLSTSGSVYINNVGVIDTTNGHSIQFRDTDQQQMIAVDDAFVDITRTPDAQTTFNYTELLNIGCFNFMHDKKGEIYSRSHYRKMTDLVPYIRQIGLDIDFDDISANSLMFLYARRGAGGVPADKLVRLRDVRITSAELVLQWVRPRKEKILTMPSSVKIQSWNIDKHIFDLGDIDDTNTVTSSISNLIIHQVPTYMYIYGTVDKDSDFSYECVSVASSEDNIGTNLTTSADLNSQESNLTLDDNSLTIRVNVLGGNDVITNSYNNRELYRITTKNSIKDAPYGYSKWLGGRGRYANYPSQFYIILGETELRSFFVRKGQTISNFVLDIDFSFHAADGYGLDETTFTDVGGFKNYNLHVDFVYDRYSINLDSCGNTYTKYDAKFI